jgi:hypothetical protein
MQLLNFGWYKVGVEWLIAIVDISIFFDDEKKNHRLFLKQLQKIR